MAGMAKIDQSAGKPTEYGRVKDQQKGKVHRGGTAEGPTKEIAGRRSAIADCLYENNPRKNLRRCREEGRRVGINWRSLYKIKARVSTRRSQQQQLGRGY